MDDISIRLGDTEFHHRRGRRNFPLDQGGRWSFPMIGQEMALPPGWDEKESSPHRKGETEFSPRGSRELHSDGDTEFPEP